MPLQVAKDKSTFALWNNGFEVGYIFARQEQAIALDAEKFMASQFSASSLPLAFRPVTPFLSMPKRVAVYHAVSKKGQSALHLLF